MGAQTFAKTPVGRNDDIVIRLKGDEYSLTNEPLGKSIIEDVDNQIASLELFTSFFHNIEVIGLRHKNTTKENKRQSSKGWKNCLIPPKIAAASVCTANLISGRAVNVSRLIVTSRRGCAFGKRHAANSQSTGKGRAGHRITKSILL